MKHGAGAKSGSGSDRLLRYLPGATRVVVRCHGAIDDFTIRAWSGEVDLRGIIAFSAQNEALKRMEEDRDW